MNLFFYPFVASLIGLAAVWLVRERRKASALLSMSTSRPAPLPNKDDFR